MLTYIYPARIAEEAPGDFAVRFRDVPEALTFGHSEEEALANAIDALAVAIDGYIQSDQAAPRPSDLLPGEHPVALDPAVAARAALAAAMARHGVTKVELGRRLRKDEKAVRRILTGKGASFELTVSAMFAAGLVPALAVIDIGPMQFDAHPQSELRWRGAFSRINREIAEQQPEAIAAA